MAENTIVDGRYRIVERIGVGGMADVFCAEDPHLGRRVALKVLHERFARDRQFVERFRREASSAAGLQHPNVVGVFDRGSHEGTYYIAMELLPGRTLKELVQVEAPLAEERVIDLGIQILDAAGFAHRHGVIHRDFKPQNVILDERDHVKVTDFGIARAGVSEMTETGSILGTAHYLSPEQAQGQPVTEASDLYSIGVLLYEMLTGRAPFDGETTIAVAVKHLHEEPPPLRHYRPDVHPAVEAAIMRVLAKDPAARYPDAASFAEALASSRALLDDRRDWAPVAAPLPLPGPLAEDDGPRRPWAWAGIALLVAVVLALLIWLALRADDVTVPRLTGRPAPEAAVVLQREGLRPIVVRVSSGVAVETVLDQDPDAGASVEEGAAVTLRVSSGPGDAPVPSVRNLPKRRAIQKLNDAGFNVEEEPRSSASIGRGLALRTEPEEGALVQRGSRVRLLVSSGPRSVEVPDVVGLSRGTAEERLSDEGLDAGVERQPSDEPADEVISQAPGAGGEVDEGTEITIVISEGPAESDQPAGGRPGSGAPERATVPDVVDRTEEEARSALSGAGLGVEVRETPGRSGDPGVVVRQRPAPGRELVRGRTVVIYLAADDGISIP